VLPPVTKRVKYASEEEKKTALKERSKAKNELIKKLLAEYQAAQAGKGGRPLRNSSAPLADREVAYVRQEAKRPAWHESVGRGALLFLRQLVALGQAYDFVCFLSGVLVLFEQGQLALQGLVVCR
jgi:hypothetical protein